ncbi:MAG: pentapeptide repeat-containing protein [Kofleriaceae bacterium]
MLPKKLDRGVDLMDLSPAGQMGCDEATALKFADRARYVEGGSSKKLTKLKRIVHLELDGPVPSWIGELKSLRFLQTPELAHLDTLAKLPHLTSVWLDDDDERLQTLAGMIEGASTSDFGSGVLIEREAPKPPKDKAKLLKALREDTLADKSDLSGVKLEGETFEHLYISHDFSKAKLANTVWKHCDFDGSFAGADLSNAVFEDCYFSGDFDAGMFAKVKAPGIQLVWCGGDIQFNGADIRDAKLYLEDDARFEINKANAQGATIVCAFCSEKEHQWEAKGANLAGAQIDIDVTADRRDEMKKKKSSRYAWKQTHLKGAKLDKKTTRVTYAPLDGKAPEPGGPYAVNPKGPAATVLASVWSVNASLWVLIADAQIATAWQGNESGDFDRAMKVMDGGPITIGKGKGLIVPIGDSSGGSAIWKLANGVMLGDYSIDDKKAMNLRVAQWPVGKKTKLGKVQVTSGALVIMLPYAQGFAKVQKKVATNSEDDAVMIPLANGTYAVTMVPFGPTNDYEDEAGSYTHAVRIEKA